MNRGAGWALALSLMLASCEKKPLEIRLMPGPDLSGWRRVPIQALAEKPVWNVSDKMLLVNGVGAKEMLLFEQELADGVVHVEWRFRKSTDPAAVYNGGIYVRTALDGKVYVQAQVAHAEKAPTTGDLIAQVPGVTERVNVYQKAASVEHSVGEWNTTDIMMRGRNIGVTVNGTPTVTWTDCPMLSGHVGIQAEGAFVEVRALSYRP